MKDIFDDALRRSPDTRSQFVRQACGKDAALFTEIESLLASHQSAETFLETPAVIEVTENPRPDENRLISGQILAHYEIGEIIGSGGMGEVYLARDTRLNRNVAIKVLRDNFGPSHDTNGRLLREARAAALLEHPNICQIYEIAETPDHNFIVMQYVVGTTLADLMAKRRLSLAESLDLSTQIIDGLAEAHARGIIHRDIKPGNVIVNQKGQAKILDFGLAKFIEAESSAQTSQSLNTSGGIMGTVPFMSPEQLRGKSVDERSDLFSFGAVLYEMVSGRPAFDRENNAETISAILNEDPDWSVIPGTLRPVVRKCLAKEKDRRYGSASELLKDLLYARTTDELADASQASTAPTEQAISTDGSPPRERHSQVWQTADDGSGRSHIAAGAEGMTAEMTRRRKTYWQPAAAVLGVLALGVSALFVWQRYGGAVDSVSDFDSLRPVRIVQWRSGPSSSDTDYRVSHDGKLVAYSSSRDGGDEAIYVKQTGDGEEVRVTKDAWKNLSPVWSPDDQRIAFVSVRENAPGIYVAPSLGGTVTPLLATEKANISLRHWSKDGSSIYYEQMGNLYRLDLGTRSVAPVTSLPDSRAGNDRYFALSPDESNVAYCDVRDGQRDIWIVPIAGGGPSRITNDEGEEHRPLWHPDGQRILYNTIRNDFYQINLGYKDASEPIQVTRGEGNYELVDLSPDGSRIYYTSWEKRSDISAVNIETGEESEIAAGEDIEMWAEGGPDGKSIVYQTNAPINPTVNLHESVVVVQSANGQKAVVARNASNPRWLPDSQQVAFLRWHDTESKNQLWIVNTVSGQERQVTTDGVIAPSIGLMPIARAEIGEFDFSPGGGQFAYADSQEPRNIRIGHTDSGAVMTLTENTTSDVRYFSPLYSPDGKTIAFVSVHKGANSPKTAASRVNFFDGEKSSHVVLTGSVRILGWEATNGQLLVANTPGTVKTGPEEVDILSIASSLVLQKIATLTDVYADSLSLAPGGGTLAFTGRRLDKDDIWIISTTAGEARKVTNNGNTRIFFANLAWSYDRKTIYFDKQEQINTISMFENFR